MRKKFILLSIVSLIVSVAQLCHSADDPKFKIEDYIPDKYKDAVWQISGNMSASGRSSGRDDNQNVEDFRKSRDDGSSSNRNLNINSRLDLFSLSQRSWWRVSGGLSGRYSTNSSTSSRGSSELSQTGSYERNTYSEWDQSSSNLQLYGRYEKGQYVTRSLAYNFALNINGSIYRIKSESSVHEETVQWNFPSRLDTIKMMWLSNATSRGRGLSANTDIGISVGYMYEGRYTAAVLHLLGELNKRGYLGTQPSTSDIRTLCDTAYAYANKYFSDGRRSRVATSSALTNTLVNLGIFKTPSAPMLIWMQDVWYGYSRESRQFGAKLAVGMSVNGNTNGNSYESEFKRDRNVRAHFLDYGDSVVVVDEHTIDSDTGSAEYQSLRYTNTLTASVEKPISLRWHFRSQLVARTGIRELIWNDNQPRMDNNNWDSHLGLNMISTVAFIADSRTTASAGGWLQFQNDDEFVLRDYDSRFGTQVRDYRFRSLTFLGKMSYWISDNTQVEGTCSVSRTLEKYTLGKYAHDQNKTTMYLTLNVTHFLM
jgi:hypothetical protein